MTLRFAPLVATLLLAFARLDAADAPLPQITSQQPARITEKESVFSGEARLAYKDVVLYADEISYRNTERIAVAKGNVILIRGAQRLVAEELTYNVETQTYTVGRFRVGQGKLLAEGAKAEGTPGSIAVTDAAVTYDEPDRLSPVLRARELSFTEGETPRDSVATLKGASLGVGSTSLIPIPSLTETPRNPTITGVRAKAGYNSNLGAELSLSATTAATPDVRLGGDLGLFSKRGVLFGPIGDYNTFGPDGLGAKGAFRTGFIKDQGNPGQDIRGSLIGNERGYVEWQHQQFVAPGLSVSAQANYWSDSFVTRDFRPEGYARIQTPDNWLEAQKLGDNYVVSLFTRVQANDWSLIQERLPELRFDGLPVEIGAGIYHRVNASVAALREDDPAAAAGSIRSDRADLYYGVMRPFSPREWFSVTPTAGARVTHYERTPAGSNRGNYTRVLGEAGFDSELFKSSATWDYKSARWDIDGLRHLVTPKVAYRYSPSADVGRGSIPAIDDDPFNTYLRPLGLANRRDIDRLPALNTFRFGVDQTLQTRDKTYGSRDLAKLDLAIDQHADAEAARDDRLSSAGAPGSRDRSDAHAFFALNPARWLRFDLYNRTTVQTGKLQELNTGLTVLDSDVWRLRVGTHYLEDALSARQIQEYTATYGLRLSEIYSLVARVRFDSRTGDLTEQGVTFSQRLSRFWTANYDFVAYDGPRRREGDYGFSVSLETQGF